MNAHNPNEKQRRLVELILAILEPVGYRDELVKRDYGYKDNFSANRDDRQLSAALFAREPVSYETAIFGIAEANGVCGAALVDEHRSLGAPVILEVQDDTVGIWTVGKDKGTSKFGQRFNEDGFRQWVTDNNNSLRPEEFLRTKDGLQRGPTYFQASLFAGLIPELEETIADTLDPLLKQVITAGINTYRRMVGINPNEPDLFKLAFWMLTAKVFADRGHPAFLDLRQTNDPDVVLGRVANHYNENIQEILNRETRDEMFNRIWTRMDFRNLSVEVLSQIWSRTLVTPETRKRLGIHRTRRSIVRYIIDQIPFGDFAVEDRQVLELCTGSAAFLVGALDRMGGITDMHDPKVRHAYFQRTLKGVEKDSFGVEIARLCLALADYPNPNGWKVFGGDVFNPNDLTGPLSGSTIVLCNPPFEKFDPEEKEKSGASHWYKPAELLWRTLAGMRPDAVLGFVLPRSFLDGQDYRDIRVELVRRFGKIDLVSLPGMQKVWDTAAPESVLLTATEPRIGEKATVTRAVVRDRDWQAFDWSHQVRSRDTDTKTVAEARKSLLVPEFLNIWNSLSSCRKLGDFATPSRGVEWNVPLKTYEQILVRPEPFPGSKPGIPPRAKLLAFERPTIEHLDFNQEYRRREAFSLPWDQPKVLMNKGRRSRGMWRVSAFADFEGLTCYQTTIAIWPENPEMTTAIAAVLNGPVANAFLTVHGKESLAHDTIKAIPFPVLHSSWIDKINGLAAAYQESVQEYTFPRSIGDKAADRILRQLDAVILDAYGLPPRLERQLLDAFNGGERKVPFRFADYFPSDFKPYFTLSEWLNNSPSLSTVDRFRETDRDTPDHILEALMLASEIGEDFKQ